jgi:hypothetical protein
VLFGSGMQLFQGASAWAIVDVPDSEISWLEISQM